MGWVVNATPWPLYPQERPSTHCTRGWVGPRPGLDGCRKTRHHQDSIPGLSSLQLVAVPAELSRPIHNNRLFDEVHPYYQTPKAKPNVAVNWMVLYLMFGRTWVQKSSEWKLAILREIVHGFSQTLQESTRIIPNGCILPHTCTIHSPAYHHQLCSVK